MEPKMEQQNQATGGRVILVEVHWTLKEGLVVLDLACKNPLGPDPEYPNPIPLHTMQQVLSGPVADYNLRQVTMAKMSGKPFGILKQRMLS